ncbi:hypothetical protein LTR37_018786 [Vermiconidia calcicola]|uniref:Uncharacterized protein n=1 Tax=Vermiconidia calcicola TaxID=1690605 RepID=A0ACC3MHQ6_9PEZI|nr:hypothetical protein LTR37_018786 [Vermiconidia calcicola]
MAQGNRQYECIVFGASGYTGKYTAEHITTHLPTDFKWAVAGRSEAKLQAVVDEIKPLNPNRIQPAIEVAQLEKKDLVNLAKKTKVLVTTVGPYHKYGSVVVEACAETGTHYLDVTGETPWVYDMIQKYDDTAKKTGAVMIPQNGIESAPSDLMCWMLVSHIRETLGVGTGEIIHTIHEQNSAPSGGTIATILSLFDSYGPSHLTKAQQPWSMCPITPPKQAFSKPIFERLTGIRSDNDLGALTDSVLGPADIPIIHRTWGFYGEKYYGQNFHVNAYMKARNAFTSFAFHLALVSAMTALMLPPVRWLLNYFVYKPGEGPPREQGKREYSEWRSIANADTTDDTDPKRAYGRMRWEGSMYHLTGVCLAEAALTIAREKTFANELGGGMLTPATLGAIYLEKLQKAGLEVECKMMP